MGKRLVDRECKRLFGLAGMWSWSAAVVKRRLAAKTRAKTGPGFQEWMDGG
jgi:hypothetical protein